MIIINPRARMRSEGLLLSVGHVFSRTVAAVDTTIDDTTRRWMYVGMCNGRSAQQESGTSYIVKEQRVHGGRLKFKLHSEFGAALSSSSTFVSGLLLYKVCIN